MRYLFGFICVLALGVMGCGETAGTGGSGGDGGGGGDGGDGGSGGITECQSPEDCDDDNECTDDTCLAGVCEFVPVPDRMGPDEPGGLPGEGTTCGYYAGTCEGGSCAGTFACTEAGIREAIAAGAGPHGFDCGGPTTVVTKDTIFIDNDVILDGESNLTVDGDDAHRVFSVPEGVTAELLGLEVTNGAPSGEVDGDGGGIGNNGTLTLTDSIVSGNTGRGGGGGGIINVGTLTLINSTVSGNSGPGISNSRTLTLTGSTVSGNAGATQGGGGIWTLAGTVTLVNSTVSGNAVAPGDNRRGGGICNEGVTDEVTLINSTVSGNSAPSGGGISNCPTDPFGGRNLTLTLVNSTVSGNTADEGDGIFACRGNVIVANSLIDGDCVQSETWTSNGYNIESPGDTCGFDPDGTDQVDVSADDLKLGELADNDGPTMTHALLPGSVAIDAIPGVDCVDADGAPLTTDQRGLPRPVAILGPEPRCDVGAFEVQP